MKIKVFHCACVIFFQNNPITKSDLSKNMIRKYGDFPIKIWNVLGGLGQLQFPKLLTSIVKRNHLPNF